MLTIKELFEKAKSIQFHRIELIRVTSLLDLYRKIDDSNKKKLHL